MRVKRALKTLGVNIIEYEDQDSDNQQCTRFVDSYSWRTVELDTTLYGFAVKKSIDVDPHWLDTDPDPVQ